MMMFVLQLQIWVNFPKRYFPVYLFQEIFLLPRDIGRDGLAEDFPRRYFPVYLFQEIFPWVSRIMRYPSLFWECFMDEEFDNWINVTIYIWLHSSTGEYSLSYDLLIDPASI